MNRLLLFTLLAILLVAGILYARYQFTLCYPEVSTSFWYCFHHAAG